MDAYDVIIVGSGPAGSTAAFFLGEGGKRVLVLEKEHLPRYKACGGGISGRFLSIFPFSFEPVVESQVKSVTYAWKNHQVTYPFSEKSMQMVMRDSFDAYILSKSKAEVRQGVFVTDVIETGEGVRVKTKDGQEFQASYVIGADGANSFVAHSVGLRKRRTLAAAIEVEVKVPEEVFQKYKDAPVFLFGDIKLGYMWIFPKHDHLSVGIGSLHPRPGMLQNTLKQVMDRLGISIEGAPMKGHPLPVFLRWERLATRRVCLVGDAAGLLDPFNGEGIRFAIKSGRLAAKAILNGSTRQYQRDVFIKIGLNHTFGLVLAFLFYFMTPGAYYLGVRNPFATRIFMEMMSDEIGYAGVIVLLGGSLPLFFGLKLFTSLGRLIGGRRLEQRIWNKVATAVL